MEPPRRRWLVASLVLVACEGASAPEGFRVTLDPGGRLRVESARVALSDIDVVLRLGDGSERALSALSPPKPVLRGYTPDEGRAWRAVGARSGGAFGYGDDDGRRDERGDGAAARRARAAKRAVVLPLLAGSAHILHRRPRPLLTSVGTMERKLRVGVIFGGRSGEHEISLLSARSIVDALDRERYEPVLLGIDREGRWHLHDAAQALLATPGAPLHLDPTAPPVVVSPGGEGASLVTTQDAAPAVGSLDVVFPVLHGTYGEDGTIQGLLEMAGVPYVGSGVLGSAAGMDKDVAKRLLRSVGLPVVEGFVVRAHQGRSAADVAREVESRFGWPVFVKPANMGSSVGVSKARKADELAAALGNAFKYDAKVLIERGHAVRELECAVLGNDAPQASVVGEIVPTHEFYSYTAKYLDEGGAHLRIPAILTPGQSEEIRRMSVEAFAALELSGLARVDFFMDKVDGSLFINEVNTLPGFTSISMYPKLWEAAGVPYAALVDRLIQLALERAAQRRGLSTSFAP